MRDNMNNKPVAKWLQRGDCCTFWFKCSNCGNQAPQDKNHNDVLVAECPYCHAIMTNGDEV